WWGGFAYHAGFSLRYGAGLVPTLLAPVAVAWGAASRRRLLVLAAVFAVAYSAVVGISPVNQARYMTPLLPVLALLEGGLLGTVLARRPLVLLAAALVLVAEPLASAVAHDRIASRTDTRVLATRWMGEHLPRGAQVEIVGTRLWVYGVPQMPPGIEARHAVPEPGALAAAGIGYVLTHDHPLPFSHVDPEVMEGLADHVRLLKDFNPFVGDGAGGALPGEHPLPRARRARLLGAPARPRARGGARLPRERERRPHLQRDGPDHGARHGSRHLRARPALDGGRAGRVPRRGGVHLLAHEHPRLGSPARDRGAPLPARAAARLASGGRAAAADARAARVGRGAPVPGGHVRELRAARARRGDGAGVVVGGAPPPAERSRRGGGARGGRAGPGAGRHPVPAGALGGHPAGVRRRARRGPRADARGARGHGRCGNHRRASLGTRPPPGRSGPGDPCRRAPGAARARAARRQRRRRVSLARGARRTRPDARAPGLPLGDGRRAAARDWPLHGGLDAPLEPAAERLHGLHAAELPAPRDARAAAPRPDGPRRP